MLPIALLLLGLADPLETPQLGCVLDRHAELRPLWGVRGAFVLGAQTADSIGSFASNATVTVAAGSAGLWLPGRNRLEARADWVALSDSAGWVWTYRRETNELLAWFDAVPERVAAPPGLVLAVGGPVDEPVFGISTGEGLWLANRQGLTRFLGPAEHAVVLEGKQLVWSQGPELHSFSGHQQFEEPIVHLWRAGRNLVQVRLESGRSWLAEPATPNGWTLFAVPEEE
jgi:hypothetical protein